MSEDMDMPVSANAIAEAVTADLQQPGQAEQAPAQAAPVAVAEQTAAPAVPAAEAVAPAPGAPVSISITDTSLVVDPATGEQKTLGEVKAERLRWSDYTRKTMALAEERKQVEALRAQYEAEQSAMKARQGISNLQLPELPDDDPYAQHIKATAAQLKAVEAQTQAYLAAQQQQVAAAEAERFAAANARLDAEIAKTREAYKLDDSEMDIVGRDVLARMQRGENVTLEDSAKRFSAYREGQRQAAIKQWQEQHRVSAPAGAPSVPSAGVAADVPLPGKPGFMEAVLADMGFK